MHIGLLSPAWPSSAYPNGIVTYVHYVREELLRQGHRVSVLAVTIDPQHADESVHAIERGWRERAASVAKTRILRRPVTVFDHGATIARAVRRLHATDPVDVFEMEESFGFALPVAADVGVPVVVRLHGPAFLTLVDDELKTEFGIEKVRREGEALASQRVITSPSRWTLDQTIARYGLRPRIAERVPNPIDADERLPMWSVARCDRKMVLFVGRFDRIKGADTLLLAFRELLAAHPDLRLVFVGPDNGLTRDGLPPIHFDDFVAQLGGGLGQALSYRGRLDRPEISELRASALVTVIASRRENQPYAALEAMLQGCPIVCTDTSGLSEIVEHDVTGLKASPESPAALAAQIRRIVESPTLGERLGDAARAYVTAQHSASAVVRQTLDVYRRVIELGARHAR